MEERKRKKLNTWLFIVIYAFMGILAGVALDTMVTFLDASESTKAVAASMSIIMGIGFVGGAGLLFFIPKVGYKKILLTGPIIISAGILMITKIHNVSIVFICAGLVMIGVCMFDAILPPFLSCYTTDEERQKVFSTTIWTNILGMVIGTWVGGRLIATRFSSRLGLSYKEGSKLTEDIKNFSPEQLTQYIGAHSDVLLIFIGVALISMIPIFILKEEKKDYTKVTADAGKTKVKTNWKDFANKYVIFFLAFGFLIRLGAALVTPYFPIYLSRMGIDRATTSSLISYQYFAMVIFVAVSPWIVKRIGRVGALGGLALVSIPFMLIIANGAMFGAYKVIAIGMALFLRSGFMNASQPVQQSLPMEFVSKEMRPAYSSIIFIIQGSAQFIAGGLGMKFLFSRPGGYAMAYYVTGTIYIIASLMLIVVFYKKYNRVHAVEEFKVSEEMA